MDIMNLLKMHGVNSGGTSKDKTPPPPITTFTAVKGNAKVDLTWNNPSDSDFIGVRILRKTTGYPTSPTDGVVVYNGANTSYIDTTVINGTTYYYRAFTFDYDNNFNVTESGQEVTATPLAPIIYGVKIDTTNSNPSTSVTYIEGAIGFTPASGNNGAFNGGSWLDKFPFNAIKPCILNHSGGVEYYLNPNNYSQKADGSVSAINNNSLGNVMIEIPKLYWKIETIGTDIFVRFSDTQIDNTFKCLGHLRGTTEKAKCYIGAYLAYYASATTTITSLSIGNPPTGNTTIGNFRTQAQRVGSGHDMIGYYQMLMLQILFAVMFKSLDSQSALGRGYVDGNASGIAIGGTNAKGMYYGETTGKLQMKCFGIEDLWGNLNQFIDGVALGSDRSLLVGTQSFNDGATGYTNCGILKASDGGGFTHTVKGTTEAGFAPTTNNGSATTFFCDEGDVYGGSPISMGGYYNLGNQCGIFNFGGGVGNFTFSNIMFGTRLMYL